MSVSPPSSVTKTSPCWKGLIVPGSTLMYGSSLRNVMSRPRFSRRAPMLADASPFPRELTTPPVTKMYFVFLERMGRSHVPRTGRDVNVGSSPRRSMEGDAGFGGHRRESATPHGVRHPDRHHTPLVPDERVTLLPQRIGRRQPRQSGLSGRYGVLLPPDETAGFWGRSSAKHDGRRGGGGGQAAVPLRRPLSGRHSHRGRDRTVLLGDEGVAL